MSTESQSHGLNGSGAPASVAHQGTFIGSEGSLGSTSTNLRKAHKKNRNAAGLQRGFHEGSDWLPDGFRKSGDGSILHDTSTDDEWIWLCSPLVVEAATRNIEGEAWGRLIRIRDRDGIWHAWSMPMAELAGAGDAYRARLLSMGLELAPGTAARNALHRLLTTADPKILARCVSTLGWHGDAYLMPDEVFGATKGERLTLQTSAPLQHNFKVAGTLKGWQDSIAKPARGNSRLAFALSMPFAAPLHRPLNVEGGGFHFRGGSSTGKTTTGEVAGSACGGGRDGYKQTWRATDNAIETIAAVHNDGLLVLDEIGQVSPEALSAAAYMLSNGQPKRRMSRDTSARQTTSWCVSFLSTGEIGLADKIRESRGGGRVMAGQQVRVVDLSADAGAGLGIFDTLHGFSSGQALADHLKKASSEHYGRPLRVFLRHLVGEPAAIERAREFTEGLLSKLAPAGADGQVRRVAQRFAIVAAGGELASKWGILPWPKGEAANAAARLFQEWLAARGGSEPAEIEAGLAAVRHFLERHGASRFVPWTEPDRPVQNRAGFARKTDHGLAYYVTPEAWRSDILAGHDAGMIAREMARRGLLKTTADGKPQTKQRLPDGAERKVYVVLPAIFEGGSA